MAQTGTEDFRMKEIFRYQLWHFLFAVLSLVAVYTFTTFHDNTMDGILWGVDTQTWLWVAMVVPILHQTYVWIVWRLELYRNTFTSRYGVSRAFRLYAAGFSVLFVSRLISIILLAISDQNSLSLYPLLSYAIAAAITPIVVYLFYSVKKYFTIERAYGIDHFDKSYNEPYVKDGIFRYANNGMYLFGLMILYLPGLLLLSRWALVVALFNHVYIWAHYYCTERPDMKAIYGNMPT
jgi:hypothetical protein